MGRKRLRHLWREPGVAARSVRLSFAYDRSQVRELPIVASWSTEFRRARDAEVLLGGQLFVGYWPGTRDGGGLGPASTGRGVLSLGRRSKFSTGGWVILGRGVEVVVGDDAALSIGSGTYVTADSRLLCKQRIEIGSDCAIAFGVLVMDTDLHKVVVDGEPRAESAPVEIGNHVWIGAGATILKGTRIGDGAVVGAGSVVAGDVPPATLVAGSPARVRRERVEWW